MSIATKTGDDGTTGLMFGRRVPKPDARVEACGSVDELNAGLGLVRVNVSEPFIGASILAIQKELIILMGELSVLEEDRDRYAEKGYRFVTDGMVENLAAQIHELETTRHVDFKGWATPGGNPGSAALDLARTICRRAERRVVELAPSNQDTVRYLNRLSDLCWLFARFLETPRA
jgi:cob(I)alamin adenosyltransferase